MTHIQTLMKPFYTILTHGDPSLPLLRDPSLPKWISDFATMEISICRHFTFIIMAAKSDGGKLASLSSIKHVSSSVMRFI